MLPERIQPETTLALAIDFQEKLVPAMENSYWVVENSKILLAGLEILGVPIIATRQYPEGLGDIVPGIKAVTGQATVMDKTAFSCYADPAIKEAIDKSGRKNIILCGVEAHVCVLQTCSDLLTAGYQPYFVADCVESRCKYRKKLAVRRILHERATLGTYETALFELLGDSENPHFKAISKLVK
jgi:nicotinamidase-related amidase